MVFSKSHATTMANERRERERGEAGCRFNRLKNPQKHPLKNPLRFQFDSETCLNYQFLKFSQYGKSIEFSKEHYGFLKRLLNRHPELREEECAPNRASRLTSRRGAPRRAAPRRIRDVRSRTQNCNCTTIECALVLNITLWYGNNLKALFISIR